MAERAERAGLALDQEWVRKTICNGKWDGIIRDSMGPPYTAFGPYERPIAQERSVNGVRIDTRETVHDTAQQRFGQVVPPTNTPYAPRNLRDYLRRTPARVPTERVIATPPTTFADREEITR
jgi:hypothetical protein